MNGDEKTKGSDTAFSAGNDREPLLQKVSQHKLQLLEACPRKFQHLHLDGLAAPLEPDRQVWLDWGARFHLLAQQRELGLSVEAVAVGTDPKMFRGLESLYANVPELVGAGKNGEVFREAEHVRTYKMDGEIDSFLLTVAYDLFVAYAERACILDWKTYAKPQDAAFLRDRWQTRLYLFVLAETSTYAPEQLSMTYWFARGKQPQKVTFAYDRERHERTREDLAEHLDWLGRWLRGYQAKIPFPQVHAGSQECATCPFARRCQRLPHAEPGAIAANASLDRTDIEALCDETESIQAKPKAEVGAIDDLDF